MRFREASAEAPNVPATADVREPEFDGLRGQLFHDIAQERAPSLVIGVAQHGEILWQESIGWADREFGRAATSATMYSLASISKPITATALMVLVERGEIDLDAPINEYLGGATVTARVGTADQATVRRVANHTSGLPLHCRFYVANQPPPRIAQTIGRYGNLVAAPGTAYQYSNLGYGLLDRAIATVSGVAFDEFVRREVFEPLAMHDSSAALRQSDVARAATRYHNNGSELPHYTTDHAGASVFYCSIADLLRFGMFHVDLGRTDDAGPIMASSALKMQASTARIDDQLRYGVGWRITEIPGKARSVGHRGGMPGVRSELLLFPSAQLVIAAVTNANDDTSLPFRAVAKIAETVLGHGTYSPPQLPGDDGRSGVFIPPPELIGYWQGQVQTHEGSTPLRLLVDESGASARLGDQPEQALYDLVGHDGRFSGTMAGTIDTEDTRGFPHHLTFNLGSSGQVLCGATVAMGEPTPATASYDVRGAFSLSYWTALSRESGD